MRIWYQNIHALILYSEIRITGDVFMISITSSRTVYRRGISHARLRFWFLPELK